MRNHMMGFADEAADGIAGQISATRALGWDAIELRKIDGVMLREVSDEVFDRAAGLLTDAGVTVPCVGSGIANNPKRPDDPAEPSLDEARRLLPRLKRLGTRMVRVMSWRLLPGEPPERQLAAQRLARLREVAAILADAGVTMVHENCCDWGGAGWRQSLELVEGVPGLKLVFDMGNVVRDPVIDEPAHADGSAPQLSAWAFYRRVREHVIHVHLKDARANPDGSATWCWPGEGHAELERIVTDLLARGYAGAFSIEPHLGTAGHQGIEAAEARRRMYIEYGFRSEALLLRARSALAALGLSG